MATTDLNLGIPHRDFRQAREDANAPAGGAPANSPASVTPTIQEEQEPTPQHPITPQFELNQAVISSGMYDKEIDVTTNVAELVIFESLDSPFLTGRIVISDDEGLFDAMKFQGTERLIVSLGGADVEKTPILKKKKFIMTSIESKVSTSNQNSSAYVFTLIDEHGFLGQLKKVSKSYTGSLERIIVSLAQNELNRQVDIGYTGATAGNDQLSAQQDITCIIPNLTPIDAMKWLCSRITTLNGSPYFIYATLNVPDYSEVSNETLDEEDRTFGNVIRLGNLDVMLQQEPLNKVPFRYTPNTTGVNVEAAPVKQMFTIKGFQIRSGYSDTLRQALMGSVVSTYSNTNLGTGEIFTTKHNLTDQINTLTEDGILQKEGFTQDVIDPTFVINDLPLEEYSAKQFHTITSSGTYGTQKSYHDEFDETKFKHKIQSRSLFTTLQKNRISIVVEGGALIYSTAGVGDIIDIDILGDNMDAGENDRDPRSNRFSGNHLIYNIQHTFIEGTHNCTMNLVKLNVGSKGNN